MESTLTFFRWRGGIFPSNGRSFRFCLKVVHPRFVSRNNSCHEVLSFLSVPIKVLQGQAHSEHFLFFSQPAGHPPCTDFTKLEPLKHDVRGSSEQPTTRATSSMDTRLSLRMICSTRCTVASIYTSAGRTGRSRSLMLCLSLLNSWFQLNTVFHEKQLPPYTGRISCVDSPLAHKKRTTACCSARVHSCNTPAIMLWLPLIDHVPKQLDTTSTTT